MNHPFSKIFHSFLFIIKIVVVLVSEYDFFFILYWYEPISQTARKSKFKHNFFIPYDTQNGQAVEAIGEAVLVGRQGKATREVTANHLLVSLL